MRSTGKGLCKKTGALGVWKVHYWGQTISMALLAQTLVEAGIAHIVPFSCANAIFYAHMRNV